MTYSPHAVELLRLTLIPDLGPIRISRLLQHFQSPTEVIQASVSQLERVKGIGQTLARRVAAARDQSQRDVEAELALAEKLGVRIVTRVDEHYPPLLAQFDDSPPLLYVKGAIDPANRDKYTVAIVGSRHCTTYGIEQAERFASVLAQAGLTIVSGGARGIDTAAHRGAVRSGGITIAVLGCGLAQCYPPENQELFAKIDQSGGAVVSELPLNTPPNAENFPARNRIISGLSLGVVVIEAGEGSGALITARLATEEHGREVMALPGRVDSKASRGSNELLKSGGAALVTDPGDVLHLLESPARHTHMGTHESRYKANASLFDASSQPTAERPIQSAVGPEAASILATLTEPKSMDEIATETGIPVPTVRSHVTVLEIEKRVAREGTRVRRRE